VQLSREKAEVRALVEEARGRRASVGLVPTMGYLHEGHLSLVRRARQENDYVVLSIFVNPAQFGPEEDLERYPRDLGRDLELAEQAGVDLVFAPGAEEMYAPDHRTWVEVEELTRGLCGRSRPGHFRGVTTVVTKLFGICRPDRAYFGQKDAQQALVIRRITRDLDLGVEVVVAPIVREADGLALSSRNVYLSEEQRRAAPILQRALCEAEVAARAGERDAEVVREQVRRRIEGAPGARVDYVELVSTQTLQSVERIGGEVLLAVAVYFGRTRLIDNVIIDLS